MSRDTALSKVSRDIYLEIPFLANQVAQRVSLLALAAQVRDTRRVKMFVSCPFFSLLLIAGHDGRGALRGAPFALRRSATREVTRVSGACSNSKNKVPVHSPKALTGLFAAFATVAFFKLVIFCVVEMRYVVVVFQAHDPQSGARRLSTRGSFSRI